MEILTTLGVVALTILIYFIVQTLITLQASLRKLDIVLLETEIKLKKLNSFVNTVENVSDIAEKETEKLKNTYDLKKFDQNDDPDELVTWLISSIKLGVKIFKRR